MFKQKKEFIIAVISLFFILLIMNFISSASNIVVQQEKPPEKKGFAEKYLWFLSEWWFWVILLSLIAVLIIIIISFFVIRAIMNYLKERNNIFLMLKKKRLKLAKIHAIYSAKHWYKVHKNTPIRLIRLINKKPHVSSPIAYYRGSYTTHEGNIIISMNLKNHKKFFFFPITDLLIIPDYEKRELMIKKKEGKIEKTTIENLPRAKDMIQFNENEVLIFAESLSAIGEFYTPVLKAENGDIIDLSTPIYQSLKDVVLGDLLYDQTGLFVDVTKKSIDMNPNIRSQIKLNDNNQNVEIPKDPVN